MTVLMRPKPLDGFKVREFNMLIDGQWVGGSTGSTIERASPGHGVVVSRYQAATKVDAERAIQAARRAFDDGHWPRMTGAERSLILLRAADMIAARADELAFLDCIESGKPISQAKGELAGAADIWRYAAALARDLHGESYNTLGDGTLGVVLREAIGVVSIITPWNFPFLIVSQKLPFALAAGCTAVVKPSELTSGSTLMLGEILIEAGVEHEIPVFFIVINGVIRRVVNRCIANLGLIDDQVLMKKDTDLAIRIGMIVDFDSFQINGVSLVNAIIHG